MSRASRRRSRWPLRALLAIAVLLVVEMVVVAAVLFSSDARDTLASAVEGAAARWEGTEEEPGLRDRSRERLEQAYAEWLEPMWARPDAVGEGETFGGCVSCHETIASDRRFGAVYMDHPLHAELGVGCDTCHTDITHPQPQAPEERVCVDCHAEQIEPGGDCALCHPPGALPHFQLAGAPRDELVSCDTCHRPGSLRGTARQHVDIPSFDGSHQETCASCHEPATCASCHEPGHPPDWRTTHGSSAAEGRNDCIACHTISWCADACHAVTPTNPQRPRPLPEGDSR